MKKKPALLTIILATALAFPTNAFAVAGGLQVCTPGSTCEVGEFLFDDDYTPITSATCTITSKNPDGSAHLTTQALTGQADGWYSYSFTAPSTEGMYRAQICCTAGSDYMCIDKGFDIKEEASVSVDNGAVAEAVWGYSDRTLSSFGTLTRDIWLSATRTLTSLNTSSSTTTTTSSTGGNVDLANIEKTVKENRLLLEELVNKPIIETNLEDDSMDLGVKLDETRAVSNELYANTQYIRSKATSITTKWNSFTDEELLASFEDLTKIVGESGDTKQNSTMLGSINWLSNSWDWESTNTLEKQLTDLAKSLDSSLIDISTRGRSTYAYNDVKSVVAKMDSIESLIGDSTLDSPDETLFGKLREVSRLANAFDQQSSDLADLLASWEGKQEGELRESLNSISKKVSPLNRIAQLRSYLNTVSSEVAGRDLQNKAFAVGGVIDANRQVLGRSSNKALAHTWLELGSIVFKSVIVNPSGLISQKAHLKYYLPPEILEEHIKKTDDGVEVLYDVERNQYYVEGDFELEPNETITVSVSTEDIWVITEEQTDSIKRQVEELMKALEGTAFYAQAITLKSDIDVALTKVTALQARAITPESRIRAYREAQVELKRVFDMVDNVKGLVTQVSSNSSMLAFVGGAQTLSVWGIAVVIIIAVAFLAFYMKTLMGQSANKHSTSNKQKTDKPKIQKPDSTPMQYPFEYNWRIITGSALGILTFGAVVSGVTAFVVMQTVSKNETHVSENVAKAEEPQQQVLAVVDSKVPEVALGGQDIVQIEVPEGSSLNVRSEATIESDVVFKLKYSTEAVKIGEEGEFIKVVIKVGEEGDDKIEGYVSAEYIFTRETQPIASQYGGQVEDKINDTIVDNSSEVIQYVVVNETPTGWLKVRVSPRGEEITRVDVGQTFPLLEETTSWYKIELDSSTSGWISKEYSSLIK